jgi:hypothetical protein
MELHLHDQKRNFEVLVKLGRISSGSSCIHSSALEIPRLYRLGTTLLCIPQEVQTAALLAWYEKPQAHIFRQLLAATEVPQDTG